MLYHVFRWRGFPPRAKAHSTRGTESRNVVVTTRIISIVLQTQCASALFFSRRARQRALPEFLSSIDSCFIAPHGFVYYLFLARLRPRDDVFTFLYAYAAHGSVYLRWGHARGKLLRNFSAIPQWERKQSAFFVCDYCRSSVPRENGGNHRRGPDSGCLELARIRSEVSDGSWVVPSSFVPVRFDPHLPALVLLTRSFRCFCSHADGKKSRTGPRRRTIQNCHTVIDLLIAIVGSQVARW